MPLATFHPAVARWFERTFPAPTPAQRAAWPAIQAGRHTLVAAPTGSGKTLTAFLAALDDLVRRGLEHGGLPDETAVVYVSPLKALSNDIRLNLEAPLAGIREELAALGLPDVDIHTAVRTGDTPPAERQKAFRKPPHIVVTTPESLYVLLGSASGRSLLSTVRTVIVDEIHAVAASKRGSHLALSLERLQALCPQPLVRVGLSATQKPIDAVARFLVGAGDGIDAPACEIVDIGYGKQRDLALELPPAPLGAVMSNDQWEQVYDRVAGLVRAHSTTLVFVNTRRMAERAARHLGERLGRDTVAAHHGSLAREARLDAEQRLKRGALSVLVATASLELGLDIGDVNLVCQLGTPRSIAAFLQRAGRSGHAVGGVPKARLFPQSRDELVECAALLDCVRRGELDALRIPVAPLDVLAQQLVAETSARDWDEDALYALVRRAAPYAQLSQADYATVVRMLADGFTTRRGARAGYVHRDAVNRRLRERKGARMTALMSGGTIPDTGDYAVMLEPEGHTIGTVNEDFAIESLSGDVFQLGNASYRILRIEPGRVRVEDAKGVPPNIPFWLGEAPGRSDELSFGVARLREGVAAAIGEGGTSAGLHWLVHETGLDEEAARQIADYLGKAIAALGELPTQSRIVLERFFDESGGTQLIIHSPFGSRLNRAWGLALRKRFCRQFNFELQAAATEDAIILSLSTSHSFPLLEVSRYLHSATALDVLVQALLDAPLFGVRWRWNATTALALPRFVGGRKVPPQLQRMKSEDLLATVFPDQVACLENIVGEREIPDHPLVAQTLHDCLHEAMDADGWLQLLRRLEQGEISVIARDLPLPSPLAAEIINARPYAFLDDAPLEERRTQAVQSRLYREAESADELGKLDAAAIAAVREEAWPQPRSADEMHEALVGIGVVSGDEAQANAGWTDWLQALAVDGRATRLCGDETVSTVELWSATEQLPLLRTLLPAAVCVPEVDVPEEFAQAEWSRETALRELLRARLTCLGPARADAVAQSLGLPLAEIGTALLALQAEGYVMQGRFSPDATAEEWCERHLLARIHRYTLKQLRREIEPVSPRDFQRFLFDWQHLGEGERVRGPEALAGVLGQLEGFEAPAVAWESDLLPARVRDYSITWLDELCTAGRTLWTRLRPSAGDGAGRGNASLRATPILLLPRRNAPLWTRLASRPDEAPELSSRAQRVADYLAEHGASFFDEIGDATHLLRTELEDALAELVVRGRAQCDSFGGLRALLVPASKRDGSGSRQRRRKVPLFGIRDAGRWALIRPSAQAGQGEETEHAARVLLRRYGVICWRLLEREAAWLPPWRELVRVYQRLEARGEIRGGRFISGIPGEQFALPDAVAAMRRVRRDEKKDQWIAVAATDPANLLGSVLAGDKVARIPGHRVVYRDGVPVAVLVAGEVTLLETLSPQDEQKAARLLRGLEPYAAAAVAAYAVPPP
ncbi:Lhr family ATP dependent helicase [Tahibacter aquaticus]|uniref:Lhr family ATP dependent helicase n=1 Tax=Tahibacter aquaticus TaxID=520092 RepID=A0A4R6YL04_9GAMM|nr:DEAD/DEAH box helicase [Tahibacter aquaticus]TDR37850.1 Lhr family ATP dependent helicase [Tahibacter aquaticus]